jgi:hypothetical protein
MAHFCGLLYDLDASDYFARVEAAGSKISEYNKVAVNDFIKGCKADGIWNAIKACCLLAGPDTLAGALVPLVGPAPTNFNFVEGDYNRVTGLKGNGSTKYLNSNRNNNADPQNSNHMASFITEYFAGILQAIVAANGQNFTGTNLLGVSGSAGQSFTRNRSNTFSNPSIPSVLGLIGVSRSISASYGIRYGGLNQTINVASQTPEGSPVVVYRRIDATTPSYSSARLSYYSIGESLDLAKLDARISTYMASIQ